MTSKERFEQNQKLVHYVYNHHSELHHSEWKQDILQEGFLALWVACTRYDESVGASFSTFAVTCIYNSMLTYMKRKILKYPETISLETVIDESEPKELTIQDMLPDTTDFDSIETKDLLQTALGQCNERVKDVAMKTLAGYKQDYLAQKYNITRSMVSKYWNQFKDIFREVYSSTIN